MLHKDFHTCILANDFLENTVAQILLFLHRLPGSNFLINLKEKQKFVHWVIVMVIFSL